MCYDGYHFGGMHLFWWFVWLFIIFWVFVTPYDIPGERKPKDSPMDVLKKRYASGEMTTEEYQERKKTLEDGK